MTGRNGKIGPVPVTPRMPLSQPHWNTATVMPVDAANDSRLVTTAVSETTAERNRTSSMRNPRPTTTARKTGIAFCMTALKSAVMAVVPPT